MPEKSSNSEILDSTEKKSLIKDRTLQITVILGITIVVIALFAFLRGDMLDRPFFWVLCAGMIGMMVAVNSVRATPERLKQLSLKQSALVEKRSSRLGIFWSTLMFVYFAAYIYFENASSSAFAWCGLVLSVVLIYRQLRK